MFDNLNLNDASMRVKNSVIKYKGSPVYINDVFEKDEHILYAAYTDLISRAERKKVLLNSKHFDWKAFSLGYVNSINLGAIYVERRAVRKYKAGLSQGNVSILGPNGEGFENVPDDLLYSRSLGDTIQGTYPTIAVALKRVQGKKSKCVAFDRRFAFYRDEMGLIKLLFKNKPIGWLNEDKGIIRLGDAFGHMREELNFKGVKYYAAL